MEEWDITGLSVEEIEILTAGRKCERVFCRDDKWFVEVIG